MPAPQRQKPIKKEPLPSSAKANGHSSPKATSKDKERPRVAEAGKRGDSKPRPEVAQASKPSAAKAEPVRASKQVNPAASKAQHAVANAKNKKVATPPTKIARKEPQLPNVFDSILNELDNLETTRKKEPQKAHSKDSHNSDPDDLTPGTSKQPMPPTPTPNANARPLTRTELTHCDPDDSLMKRFLEKDGFMERLLGYKMLKGRVDSYFVMRSNIKLDNCLFVEVPEPGDDVMGRLKMEALQAEWEASTRTGRQVHEIVEIEVDERRGPKTPPGSPGHNSSRASTVLSMAVDEKSHDVAGDLCSPLPPPPVFPALAGSPAKEVGAHAKEPSTSAADGRENLRQLALLTGTPVAQLEEFMGDDIREMMGQADKATMLAAVKDALRNTFLKQQSGVRKTTQEESKLNIPEKPGTVGSESQNDRRDESKSNAAEASACEMEISSGAASACGSDVFEALAPPPPPPLLPLTPAAPESADISLSHVGVSQSTANATFSSVSLPSANVASQPAVDWEAIKSRPPPGMPSQVDAAPMPVSFSMPPPTMLMAPAGLVPVTSAVALPQPTDFSVPPPNLGAPPSFVVIQTVSSVAGPSIPMSAMPSGVGLEATLVPTTNVAPGGPLAQAVMSQPPLSSFATHSFSSATLPSVPVKSESWRKPTQTQAVPATTSAATFFTSVTGRTVTSATQLLSNTEIVAATTSMSPPPAAPVQTRAEETLATRAEESLASMGTRGQGQQWNREQRNDSPVPLQQRRRESMDNEASSRGKLPRRGSGGKNFKRPNQKRRSSGSDMDGPPLKKTPVNRSQQQNQQRNDTNSGKRFEPPKHQPLRLRSRSRRSCRYRR
ncbi:hypothetical protein AAVH_10157 [Aphelenchoides avenae]|nr:hypothetical protein AAVH_10157 [Aphelenchus avenae]